ncbi:IPT/TIG domain-containing protein [Streptomyces tubercidicus]
MAPAGTSADPTQGAPAGARPSPLPTDGVPGGVEVMETGVASVAPGTGSTAGGDPVLIEGAELAFTQTVTIGGVPAAFGIISDTRIAVVTPPADAAGPANAVVTTTGGTATAPGAFVYV